MKRLRKIALNLDRMDWPNDYGYDFYSKSRCLCSYLERRLKKESIEIVDSTKLVIHGRKESSIDFSVNSSNIACLNVPFAKEHYDELETEKDIHVFISTFMKQNLLNIPSSPSGDLDNLVKLVGEFESADFQNIWTHQKKSIKKLKKVFYLDCVLTLSELRLYLNVDENNQRIFSQELLKTDPDEFAYYYSFKDLKIENNILTVTSRRGSPLFISKIDKLKT